MKRGDVVTVAHGSGYVGKPRPAIVVQSDDLAAIASVILVPVTSDPQPETVLRPAITPNADNNLRKPSVVMTNLVYAVPRTAVGSVIGSLTPADMAKIDVALLIVLGLAR